MWPGTISITSPRLPQGGTALFAFLAMAGDLGGAFGPSLVGTVTQHAGDSLQSGMLAGSIFPLVLFVSLVLFGRSAAKKKISRLRLGAVGKQSDWLISSDVDAALSKQTNGIEIVDISMEEFFTEIRKKEYEDNAWTEMIKAKKWHPEDTELCCEIYGALKRLVHRYHLDGVTVRCFDLLGPIKGTGCLALAVLNAEGVYAGCEGDMPSLISMAVIGELSGNPVFMANPSRILSGSDEIIFAHCTLPLNMPTEIELMTHFESGLGVAFRGRIPEGPVTIFKTSGLLDRYFVRCGELKENLTETNLCRTQIRIALKEEDLNYFLTRSIGNHHLIVTGNHEEVVNEFFKWLR
jgi:L-fucose isomerase-like protein